MSEDEFEHGMNSIHYSGSETNSSYGTKNKAFSMEISNFLRNYKIATGTFLEKVFFNVWPTFLCLYHEFSMLTVATA